MILKVLGAVDLVSSFVFLTLIFGINPPTALILACSGLLLLKGLFVITGNVLSLLDLFSSAVLIFGIFFTLPAFLLWIPAFMLLAKGFVSFL